MAATRAALYRLTSVEPRDRYKSMLSIMSWNWKQEGWPEFRYQPDVIDKQEAQFLSSAGFLLGAYQHIDGEEQSTLRVNLLSDEAVTPRRSKESTSTATATRDLKDLVAKGALTRTGEKKHTRYKLNLKIVQQ